MKNYSRFILYSMQPTVSVDKTTRADRFIRRVIRFIFRFFNRSG